MNEIFVIADTNLFDQKRPESIALLCELIRKHKLGEVCFIGDAPDLHLNRINLNNLPAPDSGD